MARESETDQRSTRTAIRTEGARFVDHQGRHVVLRGVNLGGDCKLPYPHGGTHCPDDFAAHREVSFVGRPFPIEEAREHLGRLRHWGFNCLRWLTTWEAVEHAGPGIHDRDYLEYLERAVALAGEYGFLVFIDFHQDVWSRMTGGSGAPGWTLAALGLDLAHLDASDSALVMQQRFDHASASDHQPERYPTMSWPGNYRRPANGIAWTAFFAGALFTPHWDVDGENIQHYLQRHYLAAMGAVAKRLARMPHVIGFDTLNEPGTGWIGMGMSERPPSGQTWPARAGLLWSPLDGLRAAHGHQVQVPQLVRDASGLLVAAAPRTMNPHCQRAWLPRTEDPFARHGAWHVKGDEAVVDNEDFFRCHQGKPVDFNRDVMAPFLRAVADCVRTYRSDWLLFAELSPYTQGSANAFPHDMPAAWVNANHWYDIELLGSKNSSRSSRSELAARYRPQIRAIKDQGNVDGAEVPALLGEFGIPYDMDKGRAYSDAARALPPAQRWQRHEAALAAAYDVIDELGLSSTQWNYTASNSNHPRIGDGWNQEDLSIFSRDQQAENLTPTDPDSGSRALDGFARPWVPATQGVLQHCRVGADGRSLELAFNADPTLVAPTVVHLPRRLFPAVSVKAAASLHWQHDPTDQTLTVWAAETGHFILTVAAATGASS